MQPEGPTGSQTLARGLAALALIGEYDGPVTVAQLADMLEVHRSMAYRLVRTLEAHGFVERRAGGALTVGTRLAGIARSATRDLQSAAFPVLFDMANDLDVTTFLAGYDGEAAVTLVSAEPRGAAAAVSQHPGTRHPVGRGAPGRVIEAQLGEVPSRSPHYAISHGEVYEGLSCIAVPLPSPSGRPMSLAALYVTGRALDTDLVVGRLHEAALEISRSQR